MAKVLFISIILHLFVALLGLSFLQVIFYRKKILLSEAMPYSWLSGAVLIYLLGMVFVKLEIFLNTWNYLILLLGMVIIALAFLKNKKNPVIFDSHDAIKLTDFKWFHYLILFYIAFHLILIGYIGFTNPVIDSDATYEFSYISLAKNIYQQLPYTEIMTIYSPHMEFNTGPSILVAWTNMFFFRWFDSLIVTSWIFALLSMILIMFFLIHRLTKNLTYALVFSLFVSIVPLANIHVFRSGYNDLFLASFFFFAVSVLTSAILGKAKNSFFILLFMVSLLGLILTKLEGLIYSGFLVFFAFGYFFRVYRDVPWKKILMVQGMLFFSGFIIYFLSMDVILKVFNLPARLKLFFSRGYDSRAVSKFFAFIFSWGSFTIIWWLYFFSVGFLFVKRTALEARIMTAYSLVIFLFLFYFSCFTGNVENTLQATNVSRFFLQIIGITFTVFALFLRETKRIIEIS
jgi:hypothetical protein